MKQVPILHSMEKTRDTRFLKNYTLHYTNTEGKEKVYETVSNYDYDSPDQIGQRPAGVIVIGWKDGKLLLNKEFRMGVNRFVYNMPAGHIEEGETVEESAKRELYEETGLSIVKIHKILPPAYASPDIRDQSAWAVLAEVDGTFSDHTEADEWILPEFYTREEVKALIEKERFSGRAQMAAYFFSLGFLPSLLPK